MRLTRILLASIAVAAIGSSAFAGDASTKTRIKPLKVEKSTQAPVSLGLGGLGAGDVGLAVIGGVIAIAVISSSTSGT